MKRLEYADVEINNGIVIRSADPDVFDLAVNEARCVVFDCEAQRVRSDKGKIWNLKNRKPEVLWNVTKIWEKNGWQLAWGTGTRYHFRKQAG